jgi:hypothetical protein
MARESSTSLPDRDNTHVCLYSVLARVKRTPVSNLTAHAGPRSVTSSDDAGP